MKIDLMIFLGYIARPYSALFIIPILLTVFLGVRKAKVGFSVFFACLLLAMVLAIHMVTQIDVEWFRFYFGWMIFFVLFSLNDFQVNSRNLLTLICLFSITEFLLTNMGVTDSFLLVFSETEENVTQFFNCCSRSYGFSLNASVTSVIALALYSRIPYYEQPKYSGVLLFILLVLSASITGFLIYLLVVFFKLRSVIRFPILLSTALALIFVSIQIWSVFDFTIAEERFTLSYIQIVAEIKFAQATNLLSRAGMFIDTGNSFEVTGDFALLDFVRRYGFLLSFLSSLLIFSKLKRQNSKPILIMLIGTLHYPVIFSFTGQMLFGYFLAEIKEKGKIAAAH
jgi:hypothetical protein